MWREKSKSTYLFGATYDSRHCIWSVHRSVPSIRYVRDSDFVVRREHGVINGVAVRYSTHFDRGYDGVGILEHDLRYKFDRMTPCCTVWYTSKFRDKHD